MMGGGVSGVRGIREGDEGWWLGWRKGEGEGEGVGCVCV